MEINGNQGTEKAGATRGNPWFSSMAFHGHRVFLSRFPGLLLLVHDFLGFSQWTILAYFYLGTYVIF